MPETIYRKLKDLRKLPNNPRLIKDEDFKRLCKSIQDNPDYFEARPLILSDRTGGLVIIAGNMRYEAAKHIKLKEAPTCLLSGLTEEREREIIIRDNVNNGEFDWSELANSWSDLPLAKWGLELPDDWLSGNGRKEDAATVKELLDRAAELQRKWKVKQGSIWSVGGHRLMCGDSLEVEGVSLLTTDCRLDGICTDPPYVLSAAQVRDAFENYADVAIVLASDSLAFDLNRYWNFSMDFIWKRKTPRKFPGKTRPIYYHSHAVVLTRTPKVKAGWRSPYKGFGSVIEVENEFVDNEMGHGKSPEVFQEMLIGFDWKNVGDPFVGTGAALLACEAQGRVMFGMEKEPKTLAVALERAERAGL